MTIPAIRERYHALFEKPTIAHLATMTPNDMPHVTPVWIDYDTAAERVLVNTERERRKERNVRRDPRVGISILDPDQPFRHVTVIGEVEDITAEGARTHVDTMAQRYVEADEYPLPIATERVILRISPDEVATLG